MAKHKNQLKIIKHNKIYLVRELKTQTGLVHKRLVTDTGSSTKIAIMPK